jgi:hypothetical protein
MLAGAAAAALVALLAGCVGIPGSSGVNEGLAIAQDPNTAAFEFSPEGPAKGANQQEILKGFIASFTSSTGGYAISKQFLSTELAASWNPRASVQVRSGAPRFAQVDDEVMQYSFTAMATVDAVGALREATQQSALQFRFVKVDGEWRISAAPDGIVLAQQTFQRIFSRHSLYFLDQRSAHLVPDLRWFPSGTASTRIVSALLAGPQPWLEGAVRTEFPDGTKLSDNGSLVSVVSGVAEVDLTREALDADLGERQLMLLQLTESLRTVPNISSVSISVEGTPLSIEDLGPDAPEANPTVDSQALVLRDGRFGFYANDKVAEIGQLSSRVVDVAPKAVTLSSDAVSAAVLSESGAWLVRASGAPVLADDRAGLIPPSLDESGFLWSVPAFRPNAILAIDRQGGENPVTAGLPSDSQIDAIEVSRDGARVAMLLSTATGPRLIIGAIIRNQDGIPVSLGPAVLDVPLDEGSAVDVTWVDQISVAVLVDVEGGSSVEQFVIGGLRAGLGSTVLAKDLVGGNGVDGLRLLAEDGVISNYRGGVWQATGVTVELIATQR